MRVDLASILLILTCLQIAFLLITLGSIPSSNRPARSMLVAALVAILWYQIEFLAILGPIDAHFNLLFGTRYGSWLVLGPLLYLYTSASVTEQFRLQWQHLLHFIPFILFSLAIPLFREGLITNRATDCGILTVFDSWNQEEITGFHYLYGAITLGQFAHVAWYSVRSLRLIGQAEQSLQERYSNLEINALRWQRVFHWGAMVIVLLIGTYVLYQFQARTYRRHTDYLFVIPLSVAVYLLTYQALRYPKLFFRGPTEDTDARYKKSSLSPSVSKEYLAKLKTALEEEEVYTNRELRLSDLAQHLGVSTHHLSQVINESLQQNFFDLINQYRVAAAKKRITDQSDKSLLQIAFEVGFNNKTSFKQCIQKTCGHDAFPVQKVGVVSQSL